MKKLFFIFTLIVLLNPLGYGQKFWTITEYFSIDSMGYKYQSRLLDFYFKTSTNNGMAHLNFENIFSNGISLTIQANDRLFMSCKISGGPVHCRMELYNGLSTSWSTNEVTLIPTGRDDVYEFLLPTGANYPISFNKIRIQFGFFQYEYGPRDVWVSKIYTQNGVVIEDPSTTTGINDQVKNVKTFQLDQNFPNPFNPSTRIKLNLPERENVSINVYNTLGELVASLASGEFAAGTHTFEFNASNLPSGLYICKASTSVNSQIIKMTLLK